MATTNPVAPKAKPGGKGAKSASGLMGKKIAGLPVPVVLGGVALAIVVGLYLRNKLGSSTSSTGTTTADTTPADASGGATSSPDDTSNEDLANALNGLTALLGGGAAPVTTGSGTADTTGSGTADTTGTGGSTTASGGSSPSAAYMSAASTGLPVYVNPASGSVLVGPDAKGAAIAPGFVNVSQPIPVATDNFAQAAVARSAALSSVGVAAPFGGVKSTVTNKQTGVTTTTYNSGRIVQQAPGKTAYVAKQ